MDAAGRDRTRDRTRRTPRIEHAPGPGLDGAQPRGRHPRGVRVRPVRVPGPQGPVGGAGGALRAADRGRRLCLHRARHGKGARHGARGPRVLQRLHRGPDRGHGVGEPRPEARRGGAGPGRAPGPGPRGAHAAAPRPRDRRRRPAGVLLLLHELRRGAAPRRATRGDPRDGDLAPGGAPRGLRRSRAPRPPAARRDRHADGALRTGAAPPVVRDAADTVRRLPPASAHGGPVGRGHGVRLRYRGPRRAAARGDRGRFPRHALGHRIRRVGNARPQRHRFALLDLPARRCPDLPPLRGGRSRDRPRRRPARSLRRGGCRPARRPPCGGTGRALRPRGAPSAGNLGGHPRLRLPRGAGPPAARPPRFRAARADRPRARCPAPRHAEPLRTDRQPRSPAARGFCRAGCLPRALVAGGGPPRARQGDRLRRCLRLHGVDRRVRSLGAARPSRVRDDSRGHLRPSRHARRAESYAGPRDEHGADARVLSRRRRDRAPARAGPGSGEAF